MKNKKIKMKNKKDTINSLNILIQEGKELLKTKYQKYNYRIGAYFLDVDENLHEKFLIKFNFFISKNRDYNDILYVTNDWRGSYYETEKLVNKLEGLKETLENDLTNNNENNFDDLLNIKIKPEIYKHIKKYLEVEDYFHAVEESYKIVREKLKEITGEEKATNAFKEDNFIKIFGYESKNQMERDFFDGVKFLHMAIQMFRNEKVHMLAGDLNKNHAYHYIVLASLAYQLIDKN